MNTYTGPQCPITGGEERVMFSNTFFVKCFRNQGRRILCRECKGAILPAGLTIIEPPVRVPEVVEQTADLETKRRTGVKRDCEKGKCSFCGQQRTLKDHKGLKVCTTCQYVRTTAGKRPHVLLAALLELYTADEMQAMFQDLVKEDTERAA